VTVCDRGEGGVNFDQEKCDIFLNDLVVCCEAVRSAILATVWLLVQMNVRGIPCPTRYAYDTIRYDSRV